MNRQVAVVLSLVLVLAIAVAGASAARSLQARPTAVGVVDLMRVMDQLKQQQSVRADLMGRQETLKSQLQQKQKEVQNLQGDLDILTAGTPEYKDKEGQLTKAVIDLRVWSQFEAEKLRMEEQLQIESLFRKVNDTVGRVAQDSGYDVVFFKGQTIGSRGENQQQNQVSLRYVAWNSDAVDLTDQIVQRMNNEFTAGQ